MPSPIDGDTIHVECDVTEASAPRLVIERAVQRIRRAGSAGQQRRRVASVARDRVARRRHVAARVRRQRREPSENAHGVRAVVAVGDRAVGGRRRVEERRRAGTGAGRVFGQQGGADAVGACGGAGARCRRHSRQHRSPERGVRHVDSGRTNCCSRAPRRTEPLWTSTSAKMCLASRLRRGQWRRRSSRWRGRRFHARRVRRFLSTAGTIALCRAGLQISRCARDDGGTWPRATQVVARGRPSCNYLGVSVPTRPCVSSFGPDEKNNVGAPFGANSNCHRPGSEIVAPPVLRSWSTSAPVFGS